MSYLIKSKSIVNKLERVIITDHLVLVSIEPACGGNGEEAGLIGPHIANVRRGVFVNHPPFSTFPAFCRENIPHISFELYLSILFLLPL